MVWGMEGKRVDYFVGVQEEAVKMKMVEGDVGGIDGRNGGIVCFLGYNRVLYGLL